MDWTGTAEWNAESNGVLRRMRTWYHLSSYEKFLVCGAVLLGYCQGGMGSGDWSTPLPGA